MQDGQPVGGKQQVRDFLEELLHPGLQAWWDSAEGAEGAAEVIARLLSIP